MAERKRGVRVLQRRVIYRGRLVRLVREVLAVGPDRLVRESLLHPGAVVIVPLLPGPRVVLVRQYRRAVGRRLLELPAGTLEPGERRLRCAQRELEEETGWRARRWRRLRRFYAAPGITSEEMTVYLAQGLRRTRSRPDPDEHVRPVVLSLHEALRRVHGGTIRDGKTIIGILSAARGLRA